MKNSERIPQKCSKMIHRGKSLRTAVFALSRNQAETESEETGMKRTRKFRSLGRRLVAAVVAAVLVLGLNVMPAQAEARIESVDYEGNGRIEVEFTTPVRYYNTFRVAVHNTAGKQMGTEIISKGEDELVFRIVGAQPGQTYIFVINGIRKQGESVKTRLTRRVTIPKSAGSVKIKRVSYEPEDSKLELGFSNEVEWKNAKITVRNGSTNYVRSISGKSSKEIKVLVKKLTMGTTYTITISGIRRKGTSKYGTVTGTVKFWSR